MEQLLLHLIGDYVTQSDWMARNKTDPKTWACFFHSLVYALPFMVLTGWPSTALGVIFGTHYVIDRWRLARYVCWAKNFIAPRAAYMNVCDERKCVVRYHGLQDKYRWHNCATTGYPKQVPPYMAVWLMIIADNTMHLTINYLALRYL